MYRIVVVSVYGNKWLPVRIINNMVRALKKIKGEYPLYSSLVLPHDWV